MSLEALQQRFSTHVTSTPICVIVPHDKLRLSLCSTTERPCVKPVAVKSSRPPLRNTRQRTSCCYVFASEGELLLLGPSYRSKILTVVSLDTLCCQYAFLRFWIMSPTVCRVFMGFVWIGAGLLVGIFALDLWLNGDFHQGYYMYFTCFDSCVFPVFRHQFSLGGYVLLFRVEN